MPEYNQVTFGSNSVRVFDPKVWNSLSHHTKSPESLKSFKEAREN